MSLFDVADILYLTNGKLTSADRCAILHLSLEFPARDYPGRIITNLPGKYSFADRAAITYPAADRNRRIQSALIANINHLFVIVMPGQASHNAAAIQIKYSRIMHSAAGSSTSVYTIPDTAAPTHSKGTCIVYTAAASGITTLDQAAATHGKRAVSATYTPPPSEIHSTP